MPDSTETIRIVVGDKVCLTKIAGKHQHAIKDGEQHQGILGGNGIIEGEEIKLTNGLKTSLVDTIFTSYTVVVVRTENSMYLVEKLPVQ